MTDKHTFARRFTTALFAVAVAVALICGNWTDALALTAAMVAFRRLT
jgi:hypothetical protein